MRIALAGLCAGVLAGAVQAAPGDSLTVDRGTEVRVAPRADAPVLKQVDADVIAIERDRRGRWIEIEIPDLLVQGWLRAAGGDGGRTPAAPGSATPVALAGVPVPELKTPELQRAVVAAAPVPVARGQARATDPLHAGSEASKILAPEPKPGRLARLLQPPPAGFDTGPPGNAEDEAVERFRESVHYLEARRAAGEPIFGDVLWLREGAIGVTTAEGFAALPTDEREAWLDALFDRWLAASRSLGTLAVEIRDPGGRVLMTRTGP